MTFTIWESLPDAVRFAVNNQGLLTDSMFIRFQPYAAKGDWPSYSRFAACFDEFARSLA